MGLGEKMSTSSKKMRIRVRSTVWVMPAPSSRKPEERKFGVDSGASTYMLNRNDLNFAKMETLRKSRNTTTVIAANGEVQTSEEAQVYVHDLDLFVTVQILDDTPAVPSFGKFCEEHGSANEWAGGQKPHLTKHGKRFLCKTENFVRVVVPGLSSSSSAGSSASFQQDSSSTSPSPASLRSDDSHDQASGSRGDPSEIKKQR